MQAAYYVRQGAAREVLKVGEQPDPRPAAGEVLVRIFASGVNPSDVKSRQGALGRPQPFPLVIPHSDGAGVIEAVGKDVDPTRIGERVWLWNAQWQRPFGTAATHIALPTQQAVGLPDIVDFDVAACFGIPLMTAVKAVNLANVSSKTILISGGAGAVGHYAIQVAAHRGARVLSTVSSAEKAVQAMNAGATATIDYRRENVGERVNSLTAGAGVEAVIDLDLTANAALLPSVLKPGGDAVVYGMSSNEPVIPGRWLMQNSATLKLFLIYALRPSDRHRVLADISGLLAKENLIHRVAGSFPLSDIAQAHEAVESGVLLGNVVLKI